MTFVPFKGFGKYGVVHDSPDGSLPLGVWTNARNIRFSGIQMEKMLEPTISAAWDKDADGDPLWLQGWADGLSTYWAVAAFHPTLGNRLFILRRSSQNDVGSWEDVSRTSEPYKAGQWQSFAWGNTVIFNNGVDIPQIFDQDAFRFVDLPKWGLISSVEDLTNNTPPTKQVQASCTHLYPLKSFLVASGVTENGLYQPNKIWWSDATALATFKDVGDKQGPPSWDYESPSTLSAQSEIAPESGAIRTAELLNDQLIIYTDAAATALSVVGGSFVMASRRLFNKGAASLHAVCEFNNQHFCVSQDQIYIHDGSTPRLIARDRVEEEFFKRIGKGGRFGDGAVEWGLIQAVKNPDRKEIMVTYGALGEDVPVHIPDNVSIVTGGVEAGPATTTGTVVVAGIPCKEYECDALDKAIRAMNPVSYYPMTSNDSAVPVQPGLLDAVGSTDIWQASGPTVIGDTYPGALDSCNGFGYYSVGVTYDTGLAGNTPARPDYNTGSKSGMMIATWRTQAPGDAGTGGRYEIQWGSAVQVVSIKGMSSKSVTLLITAKNITDPPDTLESLISLPSTDDTNIGGTGVLLSWTNNVANEDWIDVTLYDQLGNIVHQRTYEGALNDGSQQCFRSTVNIDKSSMQYFAWRDTAATQNDVNAFVSAFAQNQSDYVDPNPSCQPACKEYECDALQSALQLVYESVWSFEGSALNTPALGDGSGYLVDLNNPSDNSRAANWLGSVNLSGTPLPNLDWCAGNTSANLSGSNGVTLGDESRGYPAADWLTELSKGSMSVYAGNNSGNGNSVNLMSTYYSESDTVTLGRSGGDITVNVSNQGLPGNQTLFTYVNAWADNDGVLYSCNWDMGTATTGETLTVELFINGVSQGVQTEIFEDNDRPTPPTYDYPRIRTGLISGTGGFTTHLSAFKQTLLTAEEAAALAAALAQNQLDYVDPDCGQARVQGQPRRPDPSPIIPQPGRPGRDAI